MPRWEEKPPADGLVEHELDGGRYGALVRVDPANRRTVISVAVVVDGTDPATVDRCKRHAEDVLAVANGGRRR